MRNGEAYHLAQRAMADLKAAVLRVITEGPPEGLTNAEIGRARGIYTGNIGHKGHIPRALLALMECEGVVRQHAESKRLRTSTRGELSADAPLSRSSDDDRRPLAAGK